MLGALVAAPPPVATAAGGLHVDATTTYELDVDARVVRAEVRARLVNTIAPRTVGNYIETTYFDRIVLPIVGPVADITAEGPRGALSTSLDTGPDGVDLLTVNLSPHLLHDAPQDITVRYDLPAQPARSEAVTRVNEAYAAWYVAAVGDPHSADIRIEVPRDFDLAIAATPARIDTDRTSDTLIITVEDARDHEEQFFALSVLRDDALVDATVELADATVTVRSWPGDDEWRTFTTDMAERGIPVLTELVGQPLPDPTLTVLETSGGTHLGYAGFFERDGTIEVSDALHAETLLHEFTHTWINNRSVTDRWLVEGLTQEVARRAADQLGEPSEGVPELDEDAAVAVPLNLWGYPDLTSEDHQARETWGYAAAANIVDALVAGLDDDQLAGVLHAVLTSRIAYPGDPEPESLVLNEDWRQVLDLVEASGVESAPDVFRTHVLTADQVRELDDRSDARASYDALLDRSGSWTAPLPLREAMGRWEFGDVPGLIDDADRLRDRADEVATALATADTELPDTVEATYESAEDLADVEDLLSALDALADRLDTLAGRGEGLGPVERIGALGSDSLLADIRSATAGGDLDRAGELADREAARLEGTSRAGAIRLGVSGAVALALLAAVALLRRRRRRNATADEPEVALTR